MILRERFQIIQPLEQMEVALVRACVEDELLNPQDEAVLRTALSLARLYRVRERHRDVGVGAFLTPFREDVSRRLAPLLLGRQAPRKDQLVPLARALREPTLRIRDGLIARFQNRLSPDAIDRELREKHLVLVAGGGGGTGYVYLGVMSVLEELGIRPALMAGTSIGAILCLFRSRLPHFDQNEIVNIVRGLSWKKLFRVISMESRYGVPGALRLFLRAGIGRYFNVGPDSGGPGIKLGELPIPTLVSVSGVKRGMLPHPIDFYERLLNLSSFRLQDTPQLARQAQKALSALAEFFLHPEMLVRIQLGSDAYTAEMDALDAVGFSSALPGVIHYDVLREDPRAHDLLRTLMDEHGVARFIDGGLTDNMPAKAAWHAVHRGFIGSRNVFILGLNGFSPRLNTPLWIPLARMAAANVNRNRPYAHLVKDFRQTLSPLEVVPNVQTVTRAMDLGRAQLSKDVAFLKRMMTPLPAL